MTKKKRLLEPHAPVDFVILTALEEERDAVLSKLRGVRLLDKSGTDIHTFYFARVPTQRQDRSKYNVVVTCLLDMGPITATAQAVTVVGRWRPRYVLLVGIACGMPAAVRHGDVLIATQVADYTLGKQTEGRREIRWAVHPCGASLLDSANNIAPDWMKHVGVARPGDGEPARHKGVIASGGDVIYDDKIIATYSESWSKLIGIEMESGGVAAGVHQTPERPEFLMIKSVSDFGKDKHDPDVKPWREYACHAAAAFAFSLIRSGPARSLQEIQEEDSLDDEFGDVVDRVELVRPLASPYRVDPMTFYRIAPVTWSYIAARTDARRALYRDVWPRLTEGDIPCGLWCIVGEPLSGKSTFARRLGYDLATQKGGIVVRVKEGQNHPDIWNRMPSYCRSVERVVYVLVDDDFQDRGSRDALRECLETVLNHGLSLRIVISSTSGAFTDALSGLPTTKKDLKLTEHDKHELLSKIQLDLDAIGSRTLAELMALDRLYPFLAQAVALKEGKPCEPLQTLESERVNHLAKDYPRVHAALKYVSFVHRFSLTVPSSLLTQVEGGTLGEALELEGASNYIFPTPDTDVSMLQTGHPSLAQAYWKVYERKQSAADVLQTLVTAARPANSREAVFAMHLLRECLSYGEIGATHVAAVLRTVAQHVQTLQAAVGVEHLLCWRTIYQRLGEGAQADRCLQLAETREPLEVADCIVQANLIKRRSPENALALLKKWRTTHPDNRALRVAYLDLVQEAFPGAAREIMSNPSAWLDDLGTNWIVVDKFVGLLISLGSTHPRDRAMCNIKGIGLEVLGVVKSWIDSHPDDLTTPSLWIAYLRMSEAGLCEAQDGVGDLGTGLERCLKWLVDHRDRKRFPLVAHYVVGLIVRHGTEAQKKAVLEACWDYVGQHPGAGHVLAACLNLIRGAWARGAPRQLITSYVSAHLAEIHHPNTLVTFLDMLGETNEPVDAAELKRRRAMIQEFEKWLDHPLHVHDVHVRAKYLPFLGRWGTKKQVSGAGSRTRQWLEDHDADHHVRIGFLTLVEDRLPSLVEEIVRWTEKWLGSHPDATGVRDKVGKLTKSLRVSET